MAKRISQAEFERRVKEIHGDDLDISEAFYRGAKRYVAMKCNRCGLSFDAYPDNLIRLRSGCPRCGKLARGLKGYNLYLVSSKEKPFVKIGVTSKDLRIRFGTYFNELTVEGIYQVKSKIEALRIEKAILDKYATEVTGLPNSTEWFHKSNLSNVIKEIEELLQ